MKTVVRMPGPSWMLKRWMLKTSPLFLSVIIGYPLRLTGGPSLGGGGKGTVDCLTIIYERLCSVLAMM